jgi:outer membrane protein assembly factor BamA
MLLFRTGEPVSARLIEETERLMRNNKFIYDVSIRPKAVHDGVVDIEVTTRDTWSLDPGVSFGRSGGTNSSGLSIAEMNLLGTGTRVSFARTSNVDRTSDEFLIGHDHLFDGWTALVASHATNSDGTRNQLSLKRPFYARDTRWSAGATATRDDRLDSVYNSGVLVAQYRHQKSSADAFAGWSPGLIDGHVHRYTGGLDFSDDSFLIEPGALVPAVLPADKRSVSPYIRYELIEDRVARVYNRNQIGRPEYFDMGLSLSVKASVSSKGLGSTRDSAGISLTASRGFAPDEEDAILATGTFAAEQGGEGIGRVSADANTTYYHRHGKTSLFFASARVAVLRRPEPNETLQLGGDNGLRGYPLRYQTGENLILTSVENRFFTDWYPFRLFRVGGAIFGDVGRAWGGAPPGAPDAHWLADVGFGLRIANVRTAFGNMLHADLAFPIGPDQNIKKVQFLLKTKVSY